MKRPMFWFGGCLAGLLLALTATAPGQEKVTLRLKPLEGKEALYKHSYSLSYKSDRADQTGGTTGDFVEDWDMGTERVRTAGGGVEEVENIKTAIRGGGAQSVDVQIYGEWKSRERVKPNGDGLEVVSTVQDADSRLVLNRKRLSYEQFPFTFQMVNDRRFSWRVSPDGCADAFSTVGFKKYQLRREDIVTDVGQVWMPELCPVLPEGPVGKGDTWTGEQNFALPFGHINIMDQDACVKLASTYTVKEIKKKKGHTVVVIGEERKVRYKGWLYVSGRLSLLLEGKGTGGGGWEIDATQGVVLSHKGCMDIDQPEVTVFGRKKPLETVSAHLQYCFERNLDKLKVARKGE